MFFKKITEKNIKHQVRLIRETGDDVGISTCVLPDTRLMPRLVILAGGKAWNVTDTTTLRGENMSLMTFKKRSSVEKLAVRSGIIHIRFE